jgi:hypothetical protein
MPFPAFGVGGRANNGLMLQAVSTETSGVKPPRIIRRLLRQDPAPSTLPGRSCVRPPAVWGQAEPIWKSLLVWLRTGHGHDQRRCSALDQARNDFGAALQDLPGEQAADLRRRGQSARSLRELWHLRADLYGMVARHRSQGEADRRLQQVNRHFPTSTQQTTTGPARPGRSLDD